jgi:hypothetical protein
MAGLLLGGGNTVVGTKYNGLGVQTSQQGLPIPIIYGTTKTSGNLLWYGDFQAHEQTEGGKGGPTITSYTYTCAMIFGIGEGVVSSYGTMWTPDGKRSIVDTPGFKDMLAGYNLNAFYGTDDQAAWSYLTTNHPDEARTYHGIAYLASSRFPLGQSNMLPQMWYEVAGRLSGTGVIEGAADPAQVIEDFLTNPRSGARFPSTYLDSASLHSAPNSYANYCGVNGFAFSMSINEAKSARQYMSDWLEATNTEVVWSGDLLKFIPYGDMPMTGYGYTFTPDTEFAAELTDDDFHFDDGEAPVKISRADPYDCQNNVKVLVSDRLNEYNVALCEVSDQASIEQIGLRPRPQIDAKFIPSPTAGMMAAELIKNRRLFVRRNFRFRLSWEHARLEPMDKVTLTRADQGLSRAPARIMEITEDETGLLEILAEEFLEGSQWSIQYPAQSGSGYVANTFIGSGDVNDPVVFEPTAAQIGTTSPEVWMVVSGPKATWGGAHVWISTDGGTNYSVAGTVKSGGVTGELTANLAANGTTLSVDLSECGGELASVTAGEAALGRTAMVIGGEILAFTTATLTGANRYDLTGLVRGMYGTTAASHASGSRLGYLGSTVFKFTIPNASYYGTTVHLKFTSFNIYGSAEMGLESVSDYSYSITGAGQAPPDPGGAGVPGIDYLTAIPDNPGFDQAFSSVSFASVTLSNSNKNATVANGSPYCNLIGTTGRGSGKRYFEGVIPDVVYGAFGVVGPVAHANGSNGVKLGGRAGEVGWLQSGAVMNSNATLSTIQGWAAGDRLCCAVDMDDMLIWFRTNSGNWNNSASNSPSTGVGGIDISAAVASGSIGFLVWPAVGESATGTYNLFELLEDFTQAIPSGFSAWGVP